MTAALVLLAGLAGLSGCGDAAGTTDGGLRAGGPDVDGRTYVVTGVTENGVRRPLVSGTQVRVTFANGTASLSAGCNTMSGQYSFEGTRLSLAPLAMTDMGCDEARMEQDAWLAGLFEKPVQFAFGASPAIISGRTVLGLADRRVVSPDVPLEHTRWRLTGSSDADAASSVASGPWLSISADGRTARIDERCEWLTSPIVITGGRITWGAFIAVPHPCPYSERQDEEARVEALMRYVLTGSTAATVMERSLTVMHGTDDLTFTAAADRG